MHLRQQTLRIEGLKKAFRSGVTELVLFENLSFALGRGEMLAIVGQSGAGKSTLLHVLGALERPSAGNVYFGEQSLNSLSDDQAADFRNRKVGYVWQFHYLLPEFSAVENVAMPLLARGIARRQAIDTASNWLREVDLVDRSDHRPGELSGGEQQRVALARALVGNPRLLLADEPTGDLDESTAGKVFDLIERLHVTHGLTSVLVTHNLDLAARCTRTLRLEGGRLHSTGTAAV